MCFSASLQGPLGVLGTELRFAEIDPDPAAEPPSPRKVEFEEKRPVDRGVPCIDLAVDVSERKAGGHQHGRLFSTQIQRSSSRRKPSAIRRRVRKPTERLSPSVKVRGHGVRDGQSSSSSLGCRNNRNASALAAQKTFT
jgi:hypothetical protein